MLASPTQQSHLQPGQRLDRYELLYPLAQGGMATVWVARLTGKHGFEKLVAIKTILPQYADDAEFRTMFLDEARIAARIRHLNVAEILDLGEEGSTLFLVMEWVDGDSLARLYNAVIRDNQRFPIDVIVRIAAEACAGLHAAHELRDEEGTLLGVVHRDVSPQNILVGANGVTKIIDFGVAKAAQRSSQETSAGLMKGKIQYASPEQAIGRTLDRRSDIWAMGTVLYQMISGRLPFEAENQLAALHLLTSGKPPRPLPPAVPKAVSDVVRRALAAQAEDRFATADEMRIALERAVSPSASTSQVADVVARFLGDRAAERRKDVADALAHVSGRARLPSMTSEAGRLHVMTPSSPSQVIPGSSPGLALPPLTTPSRSGVLAPNQRGTLLGMAPPPPPLPGTPSPGSPFAAAPPAYGAPSPAGGLPFAATPAPATPMPPTPMPGSITGAVMASDSPPAARLGAGHYALGGLATALAVGVWAMVAMVGVRPARSSNAAPAREPPPAAAVTTSAATTTPPPSPAPTASQIAAPTVTASAAPSAEPPAAVPAIPAAAIPEPVAATASPKTPTAATIDPPVAPPPAVVAAQPPAGTGGSAPPPKKKKKKVDDGF